MMTCLALTFSLLPTLDPNPVPDGFHTRLGDSRFRYGTGLKDFAFSPDGRHLATSSLTGPLRMWNVRTGQLVLDIGNRPENFAGKVSFSPEGRWVAVGAQIWDTRTGDELPGPNHGWKAKRFAIGLDNTAILVGKTSIEVRQLPSGELLHESTLQCVVDEEFALSPIGDRWVGTTKEVARVCDLTRAQSVVCFTSPDGAPCELGFSIDGRRILGRVGWSVWSWDVRSGKGRLLHRGTPAARYDFAPKAHLFAISRGANLVTVHDAETGHLLHSIAVQGCTQDGRWLRLSPDGSTLATMSGVATGRIRLWDVQTGRELLPSVGHRESVISVEFGLGGRALFSTGVDGKVIRWDVRTGRGKVLFDGPGEGDLGCAAVTPDGSLVAAASYFGRPRIRVLATGEERELEGDERVTATGLRFSPSGRTVAGIMRGKLHVWDVRTGRILWTSESKSGTGSFTDRVIFSPDGRLVSQTSNRQIRMWMADTGDVVFDLEVEVSTPTVSFSSGSNRVAWGEFHTQKDQRLIIVDLDGRECERQQLTQNIGVVTFSPDGAIRAIAGERADRGEITLWESQSMRVIDRKQTSSAACTALAISSDGRTLAAGLTDGTILLGNVARERRAG